MQDGYNGDADYEAALINPAHLRFPVKSPVTRLSHKASVNRKIKQFVLCQNNMLVIGVKE